ATFKQIDALQATVERQRASLVRSIHTVSATVKDTATTTSNFETSIGGARDSADAASKLANDTAGTFRDLGAASNIQIFGVQPLAGIAPQFDRSADQLQQLAISLGATRDALAQNRNDIQRVGTDLAQLNGELDNIANSLDQPGTLGLSAQAQMAFQLVFYGVCLLMLLQSAFSLIAGIALFRLQKGMGDEPLFPVAAPGALPAPEDVRTATTTVASDGERDHVRSW
ncbi:MAG TPA: hypothetical protein VFB50_14870, partial [Chloroflexota bacterium]|nr:hypothetical protein [Chloroflexota bacterium]